MEMGCPRARRLGNALMRPYRGRAGDTFDPPEERTSRRREVSGQDENRALAPVLTRAARYQRTYRQRQRKQEAVLHVPVNYDKFACALIDAGWLTPAEALNRQKVETAAGGILNEWSRRWRE
jgi:hypothetical protein